MGKEQRRIGVTAGCPAGIGPEVLARAVAEASLDDEVELLLFGPASLLVRGAEMAGIAVAQSGEEVRLVSRWYERTVRCLGAPSLERLPAPGRADDASLRFQKEALLEACRAAARGDVQALVTGPIRKRALQDVEGRSFPGQTELLHHYLKKDEGAPLMCFAGGPFVLGLATVHLPLRDVPDAITEARLEHALERLSEAARVVRARDSKQDGAKEAVRVVVFGLNPHAGEEGLLGDEERRVIAPWIEQVRAEGAMAGSVELEGPVGADGFFGAVHRTSEQELPDAVLAMFHDQGLAAYKVLAEGRGVNLTWGLRVPRASPDHGTADGLAGTGRADASSMASALELATRLAARGD